MEHGLKFGSIVFLVLDQIIIVRPTILEYLSATGIVCGDKI